MQACQGKLYSLWEFNEIIVFSNNDKNSNNCDVMSCMRKK